MNTPPDTGYSKADTHMHTNLGDGRASPAQIVQQAIRHNLQVIAITDHDHVEGAKRVADLLAQHKDPPFQMITGVEVSTRQGHLLGLFVQHAPKALRSVEESIDAIKEQGGLVIIPHPLGRLVPSLSRARINELLHKGFSIDGIEIYNPSPANAAMR
jgi:predicted metal-dependent phosphoesterase TrpH